MRVARRKRTPEEIAALATAYVQQRTENGRLVVRLSGPCQDPFWPSLTIAGSYRLVETAVQRGTQAVLVGYVGTEKSTLSYLKKSIDRLVKERM
jgi:hypothetical protein